MRTGVLSLLLFVTAWCGGCSRTPIQPYLSEPRLEQGYVLVLTGIEGRSRYNEAIANGLASGGCPYAIEIYDWTSSWMPPLNQRRIERNKDRSHEIAMRVARYQMAHPGKPVILVGQSGGAAMAIWTAERLRGRSVDGIVLLAASISPVYRLDRTLAASRRGVVSFYSERDMFLLGFGTTVLGTMDGNHSRSAGMVGFAYPQPMPPMYNRLFQVPFDSKMSASGNVGLHLTSSAEGFVREYVTPIVMAKAWSRKTVHSIIHEAMERTNSE